MTTVNPKLSHTRLTHREQVLQAISDKHYSLNSRIDHSKATALRFRDSLQRFVENMPEDTESRLDWMQKQLNGKSI